MGSRLIGTEERKRGAGHDSSVEIVCGKLDD